MRHCVGEEPECNGPYCGHAEDCPYYYEGMKEDSSWRDELEKWHGRRCPEHEGGAK